MDIRLKVPQYDILYCDIISTIYEYSYKTGSWTYTIYSMPLAIKYDVVRSNDIHWSVI